jgi:hypothetical protein
MEHVVVHVKIVEIRMALPMFGGSAPPSWLNAELRYRRVDMLKRDCGKSPESLFLLRIK